MKKKNKITLGSVVILIIAIIITAFQFKSREKVYGVRVEPVKRGDITAVVSGSGKIKAINDVKISATVPGVIKNLTVKDGDRVSKGQLLVEIDPAEYQSTVAQAQAQLNLVKANLEHAKLVWERQEKLFEKELTSQEQYDYAKTQYNVTKAQYEQNQANLRQAQELLAKTTIASPMQGKITELKKKSGEMVTGATYNPTEIMTISDLTAFEVEVEIDETDISTVKLGQIAKVKIDAFPDTFFQGEVSEIGNAAKVTGFGTQEQVVNFIVKILLGNEIGGIKPGMSASVDITTSFHENVLNIPIAAIVMREENRNSLNSGNHGKNDENEPNKSGVMINSDEKRNERNYKEKTIQGVFIMRECRAMFVPVKTGIGDQQNIEVVSGIKENEQVVTGSYKVLRTLKNGDKVKIEKEKEKEKNKDLELEEKEEV